MCIRNVNVDDFYGEIKSDFLSSFKILWQNTWDWMIYKENMVDGLASFVSTQARVIWEVGTSIEKMPSLTDL